MSSGFKTMSSEDKEIAVAKLQALLALYTELCPDGATEPMPDILGRDQLGADDFNEAYDFVRA